MNKKFLWPFLLLLLILLLFLPLADRTSGSERVIIDHNKRQLVHPACFDQADLTNYIDEVSYSRATEDLGYKIKDECSMERLEKGRESVISKILNE
ncbi:alpha-amylase [Salinicoccus sp. CNSTN-B1]